MSKKTKTADAPAKTREQEQAESLQKIGACAMDSIREMVAALECDYDRLEELRGERKDFIETWEEEHPNDKENGRAEWESANPDEATELAELEAAAGDCESREDAERRIQEDPLSLEFRSGWTTSREDMEPEEFKLLLGTGGPAVQIIGEIDRGSPSNPRLQAQDWFTPWTDYREQDDDVLLTYCSVFYFGD
jgi:hypothetical protein